MGAVITPLADSHGVCAGVPVRHVSAQDPFSFAETTPPRGRPAAMGNPFSALKPKARGSGQGAQCPAINGCYQWLLSMADING